jgi:hypothetical protein
MYIPDLLMYHDAILSAQSLKNLSIKLWQKLAVIDESDISRGMQIVHFQPAHHGTFSLRLHWIQKRYFFIRLFSAKIFRMHFLRAPIVTVKYRSNWC